MDLRIRYDNFDSNAAGGSAADAVLAFDLLAKDVPWESLQAAQRAFDEAPRELLGEHEIEVILRWPSGERRARVRGRRTCSSRIANHHLAAESLERRDVPTPLCAIHFLIASLAPPIAAWDNERSTAAALRQPIYISIDRLGAGGLPSSGEISVTARSREDRRISATSSAANDWAIVELLAASAPSSRSLEPLGCCA